MTVPSSGLPVAERLVQALAAAHEWIQQTLDRECRGKEPIGKDLSLYARAVTMSDTNFMIC
jgi:hypothetical protein